MTLCKYLVPCVQCCLLAKLESGFISVPANEMRPLSCAQTWKMSMTSWPKKKRWISLESRLCHCIRTQRPTVSLFPQDVFMEQFQSKFLISLTCHVSSGFDAPHLLINLASVWRCRCFLGKDSTPKRKTQLDILLKSKIRHWSVVTDSTAFLPVHRLSQGLQMAGMSVSSDLGTLISSTQTKRRTTVFVLSLYWKFFTCKSSEPAQTQL